MAKARAVVRQWTLLRTLAQQQQGLTIEEMARHMAVAERTIRRDISMFVAAGVPLREVVGRRGKKMWRVDDRSLAQPTYGIEEALVLVVAEMLLAPLKGTRIHAAAQKCRQKLLSTLSRADLAKLEQQCALLRFEWPNDEHPCGCPLVLDALWEALASSSRVRLDFHGDGQRDGDGESLEPTQLVFDKGRLFIEAQATRDGRPTMLAVRDIAKVVHV